MFTFMRMYQRHPFGHPFGIIHNYTMYSQFTAILSHLYLKNPFCLPSATRKPQFLISGSHVLASTTGKGKKFHPPDSPESIRGEPSGQNARKMKGYPTVYPRFILENCALPGKPQKSFTLCKYSEMSG